MYMFFFEVLTGAAVSPGCCVLLSRHAGTVPGAGL
jgi:hypothetical protein